MIWGVELVVSFFWGALRQLAPKEIHDMNSSRRCGSGIGAPISS
jgi:hypothetical protein